MKVCDLFSVTNPFGNGFVRRIAIVWCDGFSSFLTGSFSEVHGNRAEQVFTGLAIVLFGDSAEERSFQWMVVPRFGIVGVVGLFGSLDLKRFVSGRLFVLRFSDRGRGL